ncbi:MAG: hypothetical protein LBC78_01365, partial [Oscillospiraceae bacterium]|nr:hypothetical protein [Oscillospiraceae bacterium]
MERFASFIIKRRALIAVLFLLAAALGALFSRTVAVNYNMADYLPETANSTAALRLMNREFTAAIPNARVLLENVTIPQALDYKARLAEIEG